VSPWEFLALIGAGAAIGLYATAVGAGGGFLLAPLLLLRHDDAAPAEVTMAALLVVAVSSGLSTVISLRQGRVDLPVGLLLSAAAVPAALLGAAGTALLPRGAFAAFFAALLLVIGLYLMLRPHAPAGPPGRGGWPRDFTDGDGRRWIYRIPVLRSLLASFAAAFLAALAGIGGGLIYTPLNTHVVRMPHTLAVPASHVVIAVLAAVVVVFHTGAGHVGDPLEDVPALGIGVIVASRLGNVLQRRLGAGLLTRFLAAGLLVVGVRTALIAL
jgi:uncharacterized membrane protein YfcA